MSSGLLDCDEDLVAHHVGGECEGALSGRCGRYREGEVSGSGCAGVERCGAVELLGRDDHRVEAVDRVAVDGDVFEVQHGDGAVLVVAVVGCGDVDEHVLGSLGGRLVEHVFGDHGFGAVEGDAVDRYRPVAVCDGGADGVRVCSGALFGCCFLCGSFCCGLFGGLRCCRFFGGCGGASGECEEGDCGCGHDFLGHGFMMAARGSALPVGYPESSGFVTQRRICSSVPPRSVTCTGCRTSHSHKSASSPPACTARLAPLS